MSNSEPYTWQDSAVIRILLIGASLVVIVFGIRYATSVFTTFFLAFVIAVSVSPLQNWLRNRGLPLWLAFSLVVLGVIVFIVAIVLLMLISIQQFVNALPGYQDRITELKQSLQDWLDARGVSPKLTGDVMSLDALQASNITSFFVSIAKQISGAISSWSFILFLAAMMLIESTSHPEKLLKALRSGSPMPRRLIDFNKDIRSYIVINAWLGFLVAVINTLLLYFLGVDFAILWGILSFFFSFIPIVGFILSFIPPAFLALLQFGIVKAVIVVVGFIIINTVVDNLLAPRVMARGLNLTPVVVVLSLFFWSWVMGPIGAVLSVPMTLAVKKLVLESSDESRWLAILMEPGEPAVEDASSKTDAPPA